MPYLEDGRSSGVPRESGQRQLRKFGAQYPPSHAEGLAPGGGEFLARPKPNRIPGDDEHGRTVGLLSHGVSKRLCCDIPAGSRSIRAKPSRGNHLPSTHRPRTGRRATCEGRLLRMLHPCHLCGHTANICPGCPRLVKITCYGQMGSPWAAGASATGCLHVCTHQWAVVAPLCPGGRDIKMPLDASA